MTGTDIARWYLDPFSPLLAAMIRQEGGESAFIVAVNCSAKEGAFPEVTTFEEACSRACKTIRNRVCDYQAHYGSAFRMIPTNGLDPWTSEQRPRRLAVTKEWIRWFAGKWAPIGVANDPKDLNANWAPNVIAFYEQNVATLEGEGG